MSLRSLSAAAAICVGLSPTANAQQPCQAMLDAGRLCAAFPQVVYQGAGPVSEFFMTSDGYLTFYKVDAGGRTLRSVVPDYVRDAAGSDGDMTEQDASRVTVSFRKMVDGGGPPLAFPSPALVSAMRYGQTVVFAEFIKPNRDLSSGTPRATAEGAEMDPDIAQRHVARLDRLETLT